MAIEGFPLSPQQKRLWSLQHSDQGSPYHVRCVVLIEGNLDPDLLIAAMEDIWDRHEILRTAFQCLAGTTIPVQVITDGSELTNGTATSDIGALSVDRYDFTGCESSQQPSRIAALADEASALPFDFARGQLSHLSLVALSPARHALLINLSALCADIASLRNLVREIGLAYSARLAGENPAGEPSQYADLAEWQNGLLESEDTTAGRAYWRGIDYTLLTLKPASEGRTSSRRIFKPALLCSTIDLDGLATIGALTHEYDVSPSELLLTCWQTLLWRLGRASAFIVATACDGRNYEGLQDALGPFSKYLPLQCQLDEKLQFSTLLQQVSESAREAREWQEYFSWEEFASSDGSIEAPFLAASFDFQEGHTICSAANLTFSISQQYSCTDRFELKLSCVQSEGHLEVEFHYDSSVFHEQDIKRLNDQFHRLLESAAGNPEAAIGDLEILNHAQRRQLLVEFNATADYPKNKCVHQLFEEQVERTPAKVALVFERQGLTYAELNARANQVAHHLRTLGVEPGVLVAICMERCLEMVVGLLGVLKAGGSYVPIDPFAPKERQAFMLEDTGATILLTQQHLATLIPERAMHTLCLDSGWDSIAQNGVADPINLATSKDAAYVIYTSGSTGQPKGVIVEHCGLSNAVNWIIETLELSSADSCFLKTPITFDAAGRELFPTLLTGGVLVIAEPGREGDCQYIAAMMRSKGISILHCVPSLLRLIIEEPAFDDTSKLRAVMCGGEPLSAPLAVGFQCRSNAKLYNVYGPTEASIDTTFWLCDRVDAQSSIPIGRPIPNSKLYVLDDLLRLLPIGVAGHLHIGGVGLARGYLNRADLTAEKFIPNPFSQEPGARLYRTGDLARYLPDGNLEFLGRADHQVKIRGYRIELEEIESVLGQHPAVREAVVIAQEEAPGDKRLVAYLVNAPGHQPTASDLRGFLQEKLPAYMVPAVFVPLESLPLLSNGKVDRRALPEPGRTRPDLEKAYVAPRTPAEDLLAEIWAHVLGVERVGIYDDFFQLGGHSLLATQVVSRMRKAFQLEMPLRRIFELPTVAGLAQSIGLATRNRQAGATLPILPVPRAGDLPLSFAQQRLWFIDQLDPGNSAYNFPAALRLVGPLDLAALKDSVNEIVGRHEALRTTFALVDGAPVQVIAPFLKLALPVVDLQSLPETEREAEMQRLATAEARRPFDLAQGPLLRITLLRFDEEEHVGLLTMHHIVSDGWSAGVLIREMAILYDAFSSGRSSSLPELPIQYADFAHWQRQWLQGEVLETQLAYWKQKLLHSPPLIELPTDRPRPPIQTFKGAQQSWLVPKHVSEEFKALSRREGATLFMTLVAAFNILLHRYTSQDDLVVGTPVANRNRLEIEGLIGFFANTLVLRTDLSGNPSFRQLVQQVREVCLEAYVHQDLPFERLVEELHLERDLSRNPLFQAMFVLRNDSSQTVQLPGLTLSPIEVHHGTAHFDLILHMINTEQGLTGTLVYNTDLFEAATIAGMLAHFQILLAAVVADPERRLSDLPLLNGAERDQVLFQWNESSACYDSNLCVHQLFEAQADRTPHAIALMFEDERVTYGQLNCRANQLAHYLRTLGVGPEIPVGVCSERSPHMILGLLGILKAGGVYVPMDPAYPKERVAFMIDDTQMPVVLTQERFTEDLPQSASRIICLDSDWETIALESEENPPSLAVLENLAYIIYTSGSTGRPKGVLVTHDSLAVHCRSIQTLFELDATDRIFQFASLSFDLSLEQILPTIVVGATLVMQGSSVWPTTDFHNTIAKYGLTVLNLPTAYWQELARAWADMPEPLPSTPPRLFIVGGDMMLRSALDLWRQTPLNSVRLLNAYGPTEATITATTFEIGPRLCEETTFDRIPIGRPLAGRKAYILDKYGNPVPLGVRGELHIGGVGLARGYLNRADLTAEKFIPNPFSQEPGARLYRTGDLARYLPDGNLEFLGRADHQVKIRGYRIELEEIESVLGQHPAVREAVVIAQEEAPGDKRLVAYLVNAPGHQPTASDLRGFLQEKLPAYMVPAVFVPLESLPLLSNGKVDRRALPEPGRTRPDFRKAFVAPRDALELKLTHLWEDVLGVRPIGVRDNFFELGGHSLAAVRLFALIEHRMGRKLPLATVFQGATVEHLAAIFRQSAKPAGQSSLVAIQPAGDLRPLFLIHPAGGHVFPYVQLAQSLGLNQPCYGLQARGLEEGQVPHTRIEEMAAYYIDALQSVQAEGPYRLGGWSAGGVVAFEMAQQLHARGHKVNLLALLDARIPSSEEDFADEDFEATLLADFIRYFGLSMNSQESLARLPKDELLTRVLEQAKLAGLVPPDVQASQAHPFIELCKADFRATQSYVPQRYPGRITLFKASQELAEISSDPTLGWGKLAAGGAEVHVVPGNHASMVYKPHVEVLARELNICLDQVRLTEKHILKDDKAIERSRKAAK